MAEALPDQPLQCTVCNRMVSQLEMRSLRCGHSACRRCISMDRHPICIYCIGPIEIETRPQSFAEVNLEMSLHFWSCEEQVDTCGYRGNTQRCHHCNLHLCPEHQQTHKELTLQSGEADARTLHDIKRGAEQQMVSSRASEEQFTAFKERADAILGPLLLAAEKIKAEITKPIEAYTMHLAQHCRQREKVLSDVGRTLEQLRDALERRDHDGVLNAQRTFQYMQSAGAYRPIQQDCLPKFKNTLDAGVLNNLISGMETAIKDLKEFQMANQVANSQQAAAAPVSTSGPVPAPRLAVRSRTASESVQNRSSCAYVILDQSDRSSFVTIGKPLDIDCYNVPGEPVMFFVVEGAGSTKTMVRMYSGPRMEGRTVPLQFSRMGALIDSFQPRRLAVVAPKKLIAMTDSQSARYNRHIFVCDFSGQAQHRVYRIEEAKRLGGIHADDSRIFVCDTDGSTVFIVDYISNSEHHKRIDCGSPCPLSLSSWNQWLLVVFTDRVNFYCLDTMQPAHTIRATGQEFRDIVHVPGGNFLVSTQDSIVLHSADTSELLKVEAAEPDRPDLLGMCTTQADGDGIIVYLCDRQRCQVKIIRIAI